MMTILSSVETRIATLPVVETFHSVQGEGVWAGSSAYFMRLAGCDVGCPWCDTKHSWPMAHHPRQTVSDLVKGAIAARPFMVVITGGEPLMHNLEALTAALSQAGLRVHLETSGAYALTGHFSWITLSPKPFKPPLPEIYPQANELKVVVNDYADLLWAKESAKHISSQAIKMLQPCWESQIGAKIVMEYVLSNPEWRVSLQTHKYLGVR